MGFKFNKELPRDLQVKTILQNFDKKQAECDALRKENAKLEEEIKQKEILYKNMLDRFNGKKSDSENWEHKYKVLKNEYKMRGEKYTNLLNKYNKMKSVLDSVRGAICGAYNKIDDFCTEIGIAKSSSLDTSEGKPIDELPYDSQEKKFICYVRDMIASFRLTGTLTGISKIALRYGVTSLTKEKFFMFGLDKADVTDDQILEVYKKIKKK